MYTINEEKDGRELILGILCLESRCYNALNYMFPQQFTDILRQRTEEGVVLKHALSVVKKSDCLEYAKRKLYLLKEEILQEYEKIDKNPFMENFFHDYLQIPNNFEHITWELS